MGCENHKNLDLAKISRYKYIHTYIHTYKHQLQSETSPIPTWLCVLCQVALVIFNHMSSVHIVDLRGREGVGAERKT